MSALLTVCLISFVPAWQQEDAAKFPPQWGVPPAAAANPNAPIPPTPQPGRSGLAGPDGGDVQVSSPSPHNQNEHSINVDPSDRNHLIAGGNDDRSGYYTCAFYSTRDGGKSWSELFFPIPPGGFGFAGDPGTAIGPQGESYFSAIASERNYGFSSLFVGHSPDGGLTVPTWVEAVDSPPGGFQDKQFIVSDQTTSPLSGAVYMVWTRISISFGTYSIYAVTSYDQAATWTSPVRVSEGTLCIAACPAVGPNGELYVAWFNYATSKIQVDVSYDGGMTFSTDVDAASVNYVTGIPNGTFRANSNPSLDVDTSGGPYHGNLYLCWANDMGAHTDVQFSRSSDGGATWSAPQTVNDDGTATSQWSPWLDVDANGNVIVGFCDRREDPNDRSIGFTIARSADGGATFQPNVRVADQSFDPNTYANGNFIGDYNGLAASDRTIHPLWTDGRNATNDAFTSRVQLDFYGDASTASAAAGGTVNLTLAPGPRHGGAEYYVLGSRTGTEPGMNLGNGVVLPLNQDSFTRMTFQRANTPAFKRFHGFLDAQGGAAPSFVLPIGTNPALVGLQLHFAAVVRGSGAAWAWASNPFAVTITP